MQGRSQKVGPLPCGNFAESSPTAPDHLKLTASTHLNATTADVVLTSHHKISILVLRATDPLLRSISTLRC